MLFDAEARAFKARSSCYVTDNWRLCPQHVGEQKDYEVYSCHVSPDGNRLATAAGGNVWHFEIKEYGTEYN